MARHFMGGILLCVAAILLRSWIAPFFEKLPADYASEMRYDCKSRYRFSSTAEWQQRQKIATRVDQTFIATGGVSKIDGHIDWTTQTGEQTYESVGLYGVDRNTRANLSGYGNHDRSGQFLFPTHTQKTTYTLWDPFYAGPRIATFSHVEMRDGVASYVFDCKVAPFDETEGYLALPGVPERYRVFSVGTGKVWVEPLSGVTVDFEDTGLSYFVDAKSGQRMADFCSWQSRYNRETKAAQTQCAIATHRRMLALEIWLPLALSAASLVWLAKAAVYGRRVDTMSVVAMPVVTDSYYGSERAR